MASFSLTEKLAVTGAFLAVVALVVGTEDDPGPVVTGQETVKELRPLAPASAPLVSPPSQTEREVPAAPVPDEPPPAVASATPTAALPTDTAEDDDRFSPELGRVPLDFSKGPPPG